MKRKKGFTLVEIMIVVLIIGLLAALAIPNFIRARALSRQKTCMNNIRQIESAKDQWAMEMGISETDTTVPGIAQLGPYMKATTVMPECPLTSAPGVHYQYSVGDVQTRTTCLSGAAAGAFPHVIP